MNPVYHKLHDPVFWEGVQSGLILSSFMQKQKDDPMLSERQAARKFGMTSEEFRNTFVICENPEIAPVTANVPGRKKFFRKYLTSDVEALITKHRNKFDWPGWQKKKKAHRYFD